MQVSNLEGFPIFFWFFLVSGRLHCLVTDGFGQLLRGSGCYRRSRSRSFFWVLATSALDGMVTGEIDR